MNRDVLLEATVRDHLLDAASSTSTPDALFDQITSATARQRQRSRWLAALKEPPMRTNAGVVAGMPHRGLAVVGALLLLLVVVATTLFVGSLLLRPTPPPLASDDWTAARGGPARTSYTSTGPIGRPVTSWRFDAGSPVTKNLVVVGDTVVAAGDDGTVHAIGLADGTERWQAGFGPDPIGSIAADGNLVFVADFGGFVHALDAESGRETWTTAQPVEGPSTIAATGGRIYAGTATGSLLALDARTGERAWTTLISDLGGAVNAPGFADGGLYASTARAGIVGVDAASGQIRWRLETTNEEMGTTVVADGTAFVGGLSNAGSGRLRAVDVTTGTLRWQLDELVQAPAIADGVAYATGDADLLAVDTATGEVRWRVALPEGSGAPVVAGSVVYVPAVTAQELIAFDRATGGELWRAPVDVATGASLAVARGHVFAGTSTGAVQAIAGDGSPLTAQAPVAPAGPTPTPTEGPSSSPTPAPSPLAVAPAIHRWTARFPEAASLPTTMAVAPDGRIWVCDPVHHRFGIFTADGEFVEYWGKTGTGDGEFILTRSNGDGYGNIAFLPDGTYFVLDAGNYRVQAFDAKRRFLWTTEGFGTTAGMFSGPAGIAGGPDGNVYVLDEIRGVVESFDRTGKVVRTIDAYPTVTPGFNTGAGLAVAPDGHLFVGYFSPQLAVELDANGAVVHEFGRSGPPLHASGYPALDSAGRVYLDQDPGREDGPPILVYNPDGSFLTGLGANGTGDGAFIWPTGVVFDRDGNLIVADVGGVLDGRPEGRIQKLELGGVLAP